MKVRIASLILLLFTSVAIAWVGPRDPQWKEVDEAMKKGLPKTAIAKLSPIIDAAIKDKAYAEAIKAIGKKIALEATIQGNNPEEKVRRLQAELAKAPDEMKPMMEAMLANWYWHYFQQNRWRFMKRTQTAGPPVDDLTTWDLPRFFAEIDKHFQAALAADDTLKKIPIADYNNLLEKGNSPDSYRPTLFDFVTHDALAFYASGEQAASRVEDAFDLLAESPIFGKTAEFIAWTPETEDEDSQTLNASDCFRGCFDFTLRTTIQQHSWTPICCDSSLATTKRLAQKKTHAIWRHSSDSPTTTKTTKFSRARSTTKQHFRMARVTGSRRDVSPSKDWRDFRTASAGGLAST